MMMALGPWEEVISVLTGGTGPRPGNVPKTPLLEAKFGRLDPLELGQRNVESRQSTSGDRGQPVGGLLDLQLLVIDQPVVPQGQIHGLLEAERFSGSIVSRLPPDHGRQEQKCEQDSELEHARPFHLMSSKG